MKKKIIIFASVYLVVIQGLIMVLLSLKEITLIKQLSVFISGGAVLLIALIIMKVLKYIIHKNCPPKKIEYFKPLDKYAFPSGHATGLASVTLFILEKNLMLGLLSIVVSIIIMIARVHAHVHDYIDIFAGIVLGMAITYFLTPFVESFVNIYLQTQIF